MDEEAASAVSALDAESLAALDDAVRDHVRHLLGDALGDTAMASAATVAHYRPIVWRAQQQQIPSTGEDR